MRNNIVYYEDIMNSDSGNTILIVGCGWIGKKLGQHLSEKGYKVYGTTRSGQNFSGIKEHNITPIKLQLPIEKIQNIELPKVDSVVISISPGRGENRNTYPVIIRQLCGLWKDSNTQVIMYSSTGVYGDSKGKISEGHQSPDVTSTSIICKAEGELRNAITDSVILRLAGLYGEDRHPVKYLAGRTSISGGDAPVNLIHREDVIRATELMIGNKVRSEVINACCPIHPRKSDIYPAIAKCLGLDEPEFLEGGANDKYISSDKLTESFNFKFLHSNPANYPD